MTYAPQKDISGFWKDDLPGEYQVTWNVSGEISMTIKAASVEEARDKADAMADDEDFGLELDDASDVSVGYIRKSGPMFLVKRGDRVMRVSHIQEGDQPREPDERGF